MSRVVAVPSNLPGGLSAERSGHFGHCECFTLLEVDADRIADVRVVSNEAHEHGGCLAPVAMLADLGATDLVVSGIGRRPLAGFQQVGIRVFQDDTRPLVDEVAAALLAGYLPMMSLDAACGGHGGCHGGE